MLYGSENPPIIDIFSNPVPMVIFAGINDKIVNIDDICENSVDISKFLTKKPKVSLEYDE